MTLSASMSNAAATSLGSMVLTWSIGPVNSRALPHLKLQSLGDRGVQPDAGHPL